MSEKRLDPFEALDKYAWHLPECPRWTYFPEDAEGAYKADRMKPRGRCTCGFRKILDYYRTNA